MIRCDAPLKKTGLKTVWNELAGHLKVMSVFEDLFLMAPQKWTDFGKIDAVKLPFMQNA